MASMINHPPASRDPELRSRARGWRRRSGSDLDGPHPSAVARGRCPCLGRRGDCVKRTKKPRERDPWASGS